MVSGLLILAFIGQSCKNSDGLTFERVDSTGAMSYRTSYNSTKADTVRLLFGDWVASGFEVDSTRKSSIVITKRELKNSSNAYLGFFNGKIPDFSSVEPPADKSDGYRIHLGIDKTGTTPKAVYILTFGKEVKPTESVPYLQDNLSLGIYLMKGINLNFDKLPLGLLTHLSCRPNCEGDELL
jgi:hypothetical protein